MFYILEGNNGATYIFNAKNKKSIVYSLRFYKSITLKQRLLKFSLQCFLNVQSIFKNVKWLSVLIKKNEVEKYIYGLGSLSEGFEIDENCSVLISPTRDKIIVHHHDEFFQKIAFGVSYQNVANEAKIYELLNNTTLVNFQISKFYNYKLIKNELCRFNLKSHHESKSKTIDITLALAELFKAVSPSTKLLDEYCSELERRYEDCGDINVIVINVINELKATFGTINIPFGLVHRDFKHWNINTDNGLLIYDFEEAILQGPPMEDLFNYYIDPVIRYLSPNELVKTINSELHVKEYKRYMKNLDLKHHFVFYLNIYLIERIIFYSKVKSKEVCDLYVNLLKEVVKNNNTLK